MTNVQISDSLAAILSEKAAQSGLSVEAYLESLLLSKPVANQRISLDELDRLLDEEATIGVSPSGTFSRAEIYSDHD